NGGMQGAQNASVQSGGNQNGLHASTSGTQHDRAPVYDTDSSAEETIYRNLVDLVAQVDMIN
nr:hypothetical protein [Tanacetum cinerariifolium]